MQMETAQPFGNYLLQECVAVGGMAEIFRAKTVGSDGQEREVAIKRILPSYSEDDGFVTMFKDEAKIAAQLDHPNIVKVFDFDEVEGDYYIAMELVRGTDLKRLIESADKTSKRFTPAQVAFIVSETAKALDYAHKRTDPTGSPLNIVHRDVTPHNVMISYDDGSVKLMDFGIAKAASRATKTRAGTVKGKCAYMSPEQARGKPLDGRSDMFSLGIIMWEMLTGRRLFSGGSDFDVLSKVLKSDIPNPRDLDANVPEELARITMKILDRDRDRRYADCGHLLQDLNNWLYSGGDDGTLQQLAWYVACFGSVNGHGPHELPEYVPGAGGADDDFEISEEATQMLDLSEMQAKLGLEDESEAATQALDTNAVEMAQQQQQQQQQQMAMQQPGMMQPGMQQPGMQQPGMMPGMQPGMHGYQGNPTGMMPGYGPNPTGMMPGYGPGMMPYGMQQQPPPKSKAGLIIGIVVVLLLVVGGGVAAFMILNKDAGGEGSSETAEETAAAETAATESAASEAVMTINTVPSGATVFINGERQSSTTPIFGHKATRGQSLEIRFELDGYEPLTVNRQPRQQSVTVEETLVEIEPEEPETPPEDEVTVATLEVKSDPEGSTVTIKGVEGSWETPATIEELPIDEELEVNFEPKSRKYRTASAAITLSTEDENLVEVEHKRVSTGSSSGGGGSSRRKKKDDDDEGGDDAGGVASLSVTAIPWGMVTLDGESMGTTPVKKSEIPSGKHTLEISFPPKKLRVKKTINLKKDKRGSFTYDFNTEQWR